MVYEKWKADLHRFARSIARHEQEAKDLVQDAMLKSLNQPQLFDLPDYKQRAWFFRVMKNRLIDDRRKELRTTAWEEDLDFSIQEVAISPLEITDLLAQLPPDLSDLIFKKFWLGLSSQEISGQLRIPASTIRYKLHLAIKQLRKIMEEDK